MNRFLPAISLLTVLLYACSNQAPPEKTDNTKKPSADTAKYRGLQGTWVLHNKKGFVLIEVIDTATVLYYSFGDRKPEPDRFYYYKSKARMGYWNSKTIWI